MLIQREELRYDFRGAQFDLAKAGDRKLLGWIFNQFLYGEVTGIQCGYWLYRAPHLNAAAFLAKQAGEEISHVKRVVRILELLGEKPGPAHPAIRFLSTGMMGGLWGEHVAIEMALGEGLVLSVFYAMAETIGHPEIHKILETAVQDEERHVSFGERETQAWLKAHPEGRKLLLAQAVLQSWVLRHLRGFLVKRLFREIDPEHPVLKQFGGFFDHVLDKLDLRIHRLGISDRPVARMTRFEKLRLIASLPIRKVFHKLTHRRALLTSIYLSDPVIQKGDSGVETHTN